MKQITTILLSMFAITGLVMAGSETDLFFNQVIVSTICICIFAGAMWAMAEMHNLNRSS